MKSIQLATTKLRSTPGLSATFVMQSPQGTDNGTITMAGEKFMIDSRSIKIWYDGTTQWSYIPSRKEVNITEPTSEELAQVNPYAIIGSLGKSFTAKTLPTKGDLKMVEMTAKNKKSDIKTVTIAIDKRNYPVSINMILSDGTPVSINISGIKEYGKTPGTATFTFQNKFAPGAEIVDLR
ncbi:MAG: hypothetical protein HDS15_01605 [Bacteroides sp.]|nr:hypothetical protein [Bacteroides sp.]